jgi:hypothetical protein
MLINLKKGLRTAQMKADVGIQRIKDLVAEREEWLTEALKG